MLKKKRDKEKHTFECIEMDDIKKMQGKDEIDKKNENENSEDENISLDDLSEYSPSKLSNHSVMAEEVDEKKEKEEEEEEKIIHSKLYESMNNTNNDLEKKETNWFDDMDENDEADDLDDENGNSAKFVEKFPNLLLMRDANQKEEISLESNRSGENGNPQSNMNSNVTNNVHEIVVNKYSHSEKQKIQSSNYLTCSGKNINSEKQQQPPDKKNTVENKEIYNEKENMYSLSFPLEKETCTDIEKEKAYHNKSFTYIQNECTSDMITEISKPKFTIPKEEDMEEESTIREQIQRERLCSRKDISDGGSNIIHLNGNNNSYHTDRRKEGLLQTSSLTKKYLTIKNSFEKNKQNDNQGYEKQTDNEKLDGEQISRTSPNCNQTFDVKNEKYSLSSLHHNTVNNHIDEHPGLGDFSPQGRAIKWVLASDKEKNQLHLEGSAGSLKKIINRIEESVYEKKVKKKKKSRTADGGGSNHEDEDRFCDKNESRMSDSLENSDVNYSDTSINHVNNKNANASATHSQKHLMEKPYMKRSIITKHPLKKYSSLSYSNQNVPSSEKGSSNNNINSVPNKKAYSTSNICDEYMEKQQNQLFQMHKCDNGLRDLNPHTSIPYGSVEQEDLEIHEFQGQRENFPITTKVNSDRNTLKLEHLKEGEHPWNQLNQLNQLNQWNQWNKWKQEQQQQLQELSLRRADPWRGGNNFDETENKEPIDRNRSDHLSTNKNVETYVNDKAVVSTCEKPNEPMCINEFVSPLHKSNTLTSLNRNSSKKIFKKKELEEDNRPFMDDMHFELSPIKINDANLEKCFYAISDICNVENGEYGEKEEEKKKMKNWDGHRTTSLPSEPSEYRFEERRWSEVQKWRSSNVSINDDKHIQHVTKSSDVNLYENNFMSLAQDPSDHNQQSKNVHKIFSKEYESLGKLRHNHVEEAEGEEEQGEEGRAEYNDENQQDRPHISVTRIGSSQCRRIGEKVEPKKDESVDHSEHPTSVKEGEETKDINISETNKIKRRIIDCRNERLKWGTTQVIIDIDDTIRSSGGYKFFNYALGGVDAQYQRGEMYPGSFQFIFELAMNKLSTESKPLLLSVLTARIPQVPITEDSVLNKKFNEVALRRGIKSWGIDCDNKILYSTLKEWVWNETRGEKKFFNFKQLHKYVVQQNALVRYIWIGDTGDMDKQAGEMMIRTYPQRMKAVFLHHVKGKDDNTLLPSDYFIKSVPIFFFRTYIGAATKAHAYNLIDKKGLTRVLVQAVLDLEKSKVPASSSKWEDLIKDIILSDAMDELDKYNAETVNRTKKIIAQRMKEISERKLHFIS
ncbi:hypothetical protein, conserved [Plasmodium gonderi]|uniref:Uncharacterized protein n=1 Tax=Plasmodium gonderi TaxID=77519 RepID=A0A1Y1JJV2_PLAGO|nr:hypothetical protein, conserved [Plasmodium gonderi]GAW81477.1 hypothetical protein, conserved [Plasmodium gonderi]